MRLPNITLFLLIGQIFCIKAQVPAVVAHIDNVPISVALFEKQIDRKRAKVYNYFFNKHGVRDNKDFWRSQYYGESPADMVRFLAMEECKRIKVEQIIARNMGVLKHIDYQWYLDTLQRENDRRKQSIFKNRPIYGPIQYGEVQFFSHLRSIMQIELKEKLALEVFRIEEEDLKSFYRQYANQFLLPDTLIVEAVLLNVGNLALKNKRTKVSRIDRVINKGLSFPEIIEMVNIKVDIDTLSISTNAVQKCNNCLEAAIIMKLQDKKEGDITTVQHNDIDLWIVRYAVFKRGGIKAFDEVASVIHRKVVDEKYKVYLDNKMMTTKVRIDKKTYDAITIN